MSTAYANRNKVRGWPRRLRHLDRFRSAYAEPDEGALQTYGRDYVKLALDPWNRLVKRTPPTWYRRRVLAAVLDLYARWETSLAARGEPFYLALWLFHPQFHQTQLVAGVGGWAEGYAQEFLPAPEAPPRPPALYDAPDYDLDALTWTPGTAADYVLRSDLDAFPELARWFERQRHRVVDEHVAANGERVYALRTGGVWVGRR